MINNVVLRATLNGTDFVSYNHNGTAANTNGIQAFTAYNVSNDIDTAANNTATMNISGVSTFSGTTNKAINALKISGNGLNIGSGIMTQGATLALRAGAILNSSGNNTISVPRLNFADVNNNANVQAYVAVNSGTLTISSVLTGGAGFVKDLPGTLVLSAPGNLAGVANLSGYLLTGNFAVNSGTVKLGGGAYTGNNVLTPNQFLI
jgi:hypothetical protein